MTTTKSLALVALLCSPLPVFTCSIAVAQTATETQPAAKPSADTKPAGDLKPATTDTKPAVADTKKSDGDAKTTEKKFTKAQIEAFLSKCSDEADAKGLDVKKGKGAARKEFRRECMRKFGVNAK